MGKEGKPSLPMGVYLLHGGATRVRERERESRKFVDGRCMSTLGGLLFREWSGERDEVKSSVTE